MWETRLRVNLFGLLTILALSGCTPKVPVFAASTQVPGENSVTVIQKSTQLVAKSVTLEATESVARTRGTMEPEQDTLEFNETDSGGSVEIPLGTSVALHLNGQPSTGYTWVVAEVSNDVLVQDGEPEYLVPSNLRGAEQEMVWKFKSVGAGVTALKLIYTRTFEKDQPPLKIFELTVKVSNP